MLSLMGLEGCFQAGIGTYHFEGEMGEQCGDGDRCMQVGWHHVGAYGCMLERKKKEKNALSQVIV